MAHYRKTGRKGPKGGRPGGFRKFTKPRSTLTLLFLQSISRDKTGRYELFCGGGTCANSNMKYDPFLLFSLMVQSVGYLRLTEVYVHLRSDNRLLSVVRFSSSCVIYPSAFPPSFRPYVRPHFRSLPLPLSGLGDPKEPLFPLLFLASFRPLSDSGAEGTPEKRIWRRGFLLSTNTTGESFPTSPFLLSLLLGDFEIPFSPRRWRFPPS